MYDTRFSLTVLMSYHTIREREKDGWVRELRAWEYD